MSDGSSTTLSSTLPFCSTTPQPPLLSLTQQQHPVPETLLEATPIINGFPVDSVFEQELDRRLSLDVDANGNTNIASSYENFEEGGLYSFEEFIKAPGSASARSRVLANNGEVVNRDKEIDWKRVVDEFSASMDQSDRQKQMDDVFFNVALDSAQMNRSNKVPEDPLIEGGKAQSKHRFSFSKPATAKRSALYVVENQKSGTTQPSSSSGVCLTQTFCPTVSARSNSSMNSSSYGGTGFDDQLAANSVAPTYTYEHSNSSSLYGNQLPPDEPRMVQVDTLQITPNSLSCRPSNASTRMLTVHKYGKQMGGDGLVLAIVHAPQLGNGRQAGGRQSTDEEMTVYTTADTTHPNPNYNRTTYTGLFVEKLLCCFSGGEAQRRRDDHYRVEKSQGAVINFAQPDKYSWDVERPDPKNFTFADAADAVLIKEPGQVNGQQFAIENCIDSILVVLDHSSTVIIDDCKNCIILLGPCKGSLFMRDCSNCVIYAICQQFRSRDCQDIEARLFCTTAPTIEESNHLQFSPLWIGYEGIEKQLSAAGLSPFTNNWSKVQNFTPESAKFSIVAMPSQTSVPSHAVVGFQINHKFQLLVVQSPYGLTLLPDESFFFNVSLEKSLRAYEERVLLLVKSFGKYSILKTPEQLYYEARQLIRDVFRQANQPLNTSSETAIIRLLDIKDIDLRPGEMETVLQLKFNSKSCGGKLLVVELAGADARHLSSKAIAATSSGYELVDLISEANTNFYRTQLYRLNEINSSV